MTVSTVFLLLLTYSAGNAWAKVLPTRTLTDGVSSSKLDRLIHFINPGPFTIKEVYTLLSAHMCSLAQRYFQHVVASLVASTAASGSSAVQNFAVQKVCSYLHSLHLYFHTSSLALLRHQGRSYDCYSCNLLHGLLRVSRLFDVVYSPLTGLLNRTDMGSWASFAHLLCILPKWFTGQ